MEIMLRRRLSISDGGERARAARSASRHDLAAVSGNKDIAYNEGNVNVDQDTKSILCFNRKVKPA